MDEKLKRTTLNTLQSIKNENPAKKSSSCDSRGRLYSYPTSNWSRSLENSTVPLVRDQCTFYCLVLSLGLPILEDYANLKGGSDHIYVGTGASYYVTQALSSLSESHGDQLTKKYKSPEKHSKKLSKGLFVVKRLRAGSSRPSVAETAYALAAITNEVRVLGHQGLKLSANLTQLLAVACDQMGPNGSAWPRLLLEFMDCGDLGQFFKACPEAKLWHTQCCISIDVLSGLKDLHDHGIAHLDLKTENILVNRMESPSQHPLNSMYQAKICDFGFSVILSDYPKDELFTTKVGTDRWLPPEFTRDRIAINVQDLLKSDIYCFGLLASRIFMNCGDPFGNIETLQVHELRKKTEALPIYCTGRDSGFQNMLKLMTDAMFRDAPNYTDIQKVFIQKILYQTLPYDQKERCELQDIMLHLLSFYSLGGDTEDRGERANPDSQLNVSRSGDIGTAKVLVPSTISESIKNLSNPVNSETKQIPRLEELLPNYWFQKEGPHNLIGSIPNLENALLFHKATGNFPKPIFDEIIRTLEEVAVGSNHPITTISAEAKYQLAVACFEGIGMPKDRYKGLEWVGDAALNDSRKALRFAPNLFASMDEPMPMNLFQRANSALPELAREELSMCFELIITGKDCNRLILPSAERWIQTEPQSYVQFLMSEEFCWLKARSILKALASEGYGRGYVDINIDPIEVMLQVAAAEGIIGTFQALMGAPGIDVNGDSYLAGLSPFLISCIFGNFDVAIFLAEAGADISCRDPFSKRTVFHFLHNFQTKDQILKMIGLGLKAGLSINELDCHGITPLMATLVGWDYSRGIAATCLESHDAKRQPFANDRWRLIATNAAGKLDISAMKVVLQTIETSPDCLPQFAGLEGFPEWTLAHEKAKMFIAMLYTQEFCRRKFCGSEFVQTLKTAIDMLVDSVMEQKFQTLNTAHRKPLIFACFCGKEDLVEVLLERKDRLDINDASNPQHLTALHSAAWEGSYATIIRLLDQGANPLLMDTEGDTFFHKLAKRWPKSLSRLIEQLRSQKEWKWNQQQITIREVLELRGRHGRNIWMMLLDEGSPDHLEIAEMLRLEYELDYDTCCIEIPAGIPGGSKLHITPMGWLALSTIITRLYNISQANFLLNSKPLPKFVCDTERGTLLHYAVKASDHHERESNPTGFLLLENLLRAYPGREFLEMQDNSGSTVFHMAANCANWVALDIIRRHIEKYKLKVNINILNKEGKTPLSAIGTTNSQQSDSIGRGPYLELLMRNSIKTLEQLRQLGGWIPTERDGIILLGSVYTIPLKAITKEIFIQKMEALCESRGISWEYSNDEFSYPQILEASSLIYFVELYWGFDRFYFRGKQLENTNLRDFIEKRAEKREKLFRMLGECPWTETQHTQIVSGHLVEWHRKGRTWKVKEVEELEKYINESLQNDFGDVLKHLLILETDDPVLLGKVEGFNIKDIKITLEEDEEIG